MAGSERILQLSPEYACDIQIFDAEPWKEQGPIDELIDLQQRAFLADRLDNYGQFGSLVMEMSRVEHSIGNHSEAAAYANEAAEAFQRGEYREGAIAAHSTLAKEYRTLYSPDLALASLGEVISLRTKLSGEIYDSHDLVLDGDMQPVLRLIQSFTATYNSSWLTHHDTEDKEYPSPCLPKSARPSRDATESLFYSLDHLVDIPVAVTDKEAAMILLRLCLLYKDLASRRLNLSSTDRKIANSKSGLFGALSALTVGIHSPQATKALKNGNFAISEIFR